MAAIRIPLRTAIALTLAVALVAGALAAPAVHADSPIAQPSLPLGHAGRWITDASGRVVIVHGLNQVMKIAPYEPSQDGFGDADAAFLAAAGFNAVRLGVIWAAVEPQPGVYNDAYLASIRETVSTLARHGIVSLLDLHQDLYSDTFQGEGAPDWAVQTGGLPNPSDGFTWDYFLNPALEHAFDAFYANAPGPGGVGLADRFAATWAHVAAYFRGNPDVLGYELLNEPFPGTIWETCLLPVIGCPAADARITALYRKVDAAIRAVDPSTLVWYEPNGLFGLGAVTDLGSIGDPNAGFAFHDYCSLVPLTNSNLGCDPVDDAVFAHAARYVQGHGVAELETEFGATNAADNLNAMVRRADSNMVGWLEWAFTGNDITSIDSAAQALVYDPSQPPVGANVNSAKLDILAEPYPQLVSGTPLSYGYQPASGTFTLTYSTERADGAGAFAAGSETDVALPEIQFPNGYAVAADGAAVASAPDAPLLRLRSVPGTATVSVTVTPLP